MSAARSASAERRRDWLWGASLTVGALLLLSRGLGMGHEVGVSIVGGDRMLRGEVPYRDFWTMYAPGSAASTAVVLALFGRELIAVYASSALLSVASVAALFVALRRAGAGPPVAFGVGALWACLLWSPVPVLSSYALPRVLLVIGWERALHAVRSGRRGPLLAAGMLFGVSAWFKHDIGAYATAGTALALLGARPLLRLRSGLFTDPLRAVGVLVLGAGIAVLPVLFAVGILAGADAWQDLVTFPATDFRVVRGEQYPGLLPRLDPIVAWLREPTDLRRAQRAGAAVHDWVSTNGPQWVFCVAAVGLLSLAWRRRAPELAAAMAVPLACMPFFWMAAHVQINTHVFSMALLSALLLPLLWELCSQFSGRAYLLRLALVALYSVYAIGMLVSPLMRVARLSVEAAELRPLDLPGTSHTQVSARDYAIYRPITEFIRANVREGEPIQVVVRRSDAVVIGNADFYFLADRPVATRYHELHPGIVDRDDIQQEMIRDLERKAVRCLVRWNFGWSDARLDRILAGRRRNLPELGARRLDRYVEENFRVVRRHGAYDVMWRRGAPRPWKSDEPGF